jgi:hypothetical protein
MADVAKAAELDGENAIVVTDATTENPTVVSLKLATGETVLSQDANGLKSTLDLTYDSTAKEIRLWGISETEPIATVDATAFIKDGMLADAEIITASNEEGLTPGHRYIKFTFKTYQQGQQGQEEVLKVEYLDVEDLFDSYTHGNEWIVIDQSANTISHKTQSLFTPVEGQTAPKTAFGDNVAADAVADVTIEGAGQSTKFAVPSFVVDAAGHVTAAEDKVVEVKLPAAPTTAEKTIVTYEPKKQSFTPAAGTTTVELAAEAYDYDVYLNGQLLTAGDATLGTDKKTITLSNYASMITEGDEIIVRYFVKHEDTFTVFAPATQEPAE